MTTLLRNPVTFEGQTIRVTGQYRSIPLQVCGNTIHRSPATWKLIFGDIETLAAGFDEALRPLAASGLSLTVEGRWQKWEGPVGCGRRAPSQEIWYLAASRIVSPNPLVKSDSDDVIVLQPTLTPVVGLTLEPDVNVTVGVEVITLEVPTNTPGSSIGTPTPSPTFQLIPTSQASATATNSPAPSATSATSSSSTSTPTPTTEASGGTAVTGTPTPTASATTSSGTPSATTTPTDQGALLTDLVINETLSANSSHSWQFSLSGDDRIVITAGSALNIDLKLELIADNGSVVASADLGGTGEPETLLYTAPNPSADYQVIISSSSGSTGDYVLMRFDSDSEPVVFIQETIIYGSGGSGSILEGNDHFWNFGGQAGDTITIEVSSTSSEGDLIFYLIGPDGSELEFIDETGVGEIESLISYTLPDSGFYSIGIGELDFGEVSYSMTLTQ